MARKSRNKPIKKVIYVFWEGETEQEYIKFLKDEFENIAVIYYCTKKALLRLLSPIIITKITMITKISEILYQNLMNYGFSLIRKLKWAISGTKNELFRRYYKFKEKRNPLKIRLLMTTGCAEYWLLLHYRKTAPAIATPADKDKILMEVKKIVPSYKKGDKASIKKLHLIMKMLLKMEYGL